VSGVDALDRLVRETAARLAGALGAAPGKKTLGEHVALFLGRGLAQTLDSLADRLDTRAATTRPPHPTLQGKTIGETLQTIVAQALSNPDKLARHYAQFAQEAIAILEGRSDIAPEKGDFRFKDPLWQDSPLLRAALQLYLAVERHLHDWVSGAPLTEADRRRVLFLFDQLIAALAPSNLPLNPASLRRAQSTNGDSVISGLQHWVDDALTNRFMPRQIRRGAYTIGRDLAVTPGAVVYRNDLLELIQYAPQTPSVRLHPVLLLPPQINKYYVFDLRPQNSIVGHLLRSGLQLFTISWRNPTRSQAHWGLDTYVQAVLSAVDTVCSIAGTASLGLISACAGGLTAMALLGYLAEQGTARVANHSLLVTCLFPGDGSDLELFATPELLARVQHAMQENGVLEGDDLSKVFFWLRPTDLVWRYWINNYLLGKDPPRLDVLQWDNDPTRLPAALHRDFVAMYEHDVFRRPGAMRVLGRPIDYRKVSVASYFVGGEDDYMMPWRGCYRACQVFRGRHEFVLSISGHVQSILRPPRVANKHYYANGSQDGTADDWLHSATRYEGSWWDHWHRWLNAMSGDLIPAPAVLGNKRHPVLMAAPGEYVFG